MLNPKLETNSNVKIIKFKTVELNLFEFLDFGFVQGLEFKLFEFAPHHGSPLKSKEKKQTRPLRPSWDEYFMDITHLVAKRSTCLRRQVGAILVKNKKILATGYNGAPSRLEHCLDVGCLRERMKIPSGERHELCRGLHAEQNAIIQAAYHGVGIQGAILYCTNHPCIICSKMIINSGIERIVYEEGYADALAKEMLKESGILVEQYKRKRRGSRGNS